MEETNGMQRLMEMPVEELKACGRLKFQLLTDISQLLRHFARSIADEISSNNQQGKPTRLILPVGPVAQYPLLADITNRERISWRNVIVFQMDEFLDWQGRSIPSSHPLSFEGHLRRNLFGPIDEELRPAPEQHVCPDPFRIDRVSDAIREAGGIDVCYGGIGYHGHVAFNEPPNTPWRRISEKALRESLTRVVALSSDSIVVQSIGSAGGNAAAVPPMAVTLGMKDILASRKIRLYCAGGERHRAVFRIAVAGEVTTDYPVTLVQGHADAVVHADWATAEPIAIGLR